MRTINRVIGITHILSILTCGYLDLYSIKQPFVANTIVFQLSLTDSLVLSIFLFSIIFIGNIFGSVASFLDFSIYPFLSLGLGMAGLCALLLFTKAVNLFLLVFGAISVFQIIVSLWQIVRLNILMKLGE